MKHLSAAGCAMLLAALTCGSACRSGEIDSRSSPHAIARMCRARTYTSTAFTAWSTRFWR